VRSATASYDTWSPPSIIPVKANCCSRRANRAPNSRALAPVGGWSVGNLRLPQQLVEEILHFPSTIRCHSSSLKVVSCAPGTSCASRHSHAKCACTLLVGTTHSMSKAWVVAQNAGSDHLWKWKIIECPTNSSRCLKSYCNLHPRQPPEPRGRTGRPESIWSAARRSWQQRGHRLKIIGKAKA